MSGKTVIDYRFTQASAANPDGSLAGEIKGCEHRAIDIDVAGWGALKGALLFKEGGCFVRVPVPEGLDDGGAFAVEMVVRPHQAPAAARAMRLMEGQHPAFAFSLVGTANGARVAGSLHSVDRWVGTSGAAPPIPVGPAAAWSSVAMVFSGDDILLFVNQKLVERRVIQNADARPVGELPLIVGTWVDGRRDQYLGEIAAIRAWDGLPPHLLPAIVEAEKTGLGEIDSKHADLGGAAGFLGAPTADEQQLGGGRRRRAFANGDIYWSPSAGAHEVHGAIKGLYDNLGGTGSFLGAPLTDELAGTARNARYGRFEGGAIYWSPATGAREVHGSILYRYLDLGAERSFLGLPTSNEVDVPGGRKSDFQNGTIFWSSGTNAFEVHGAIRDRYLALGGPGGFVGFPLSNESDVIGANGRPTGGKLSRFTGATIYWSPASGAFEVHGAIRDLYEEMGGARSALGYPISNEESVPGTDIRYNDFEKGVIRWRPSTGARAVVDLNLHLGKVTTGPIDDGLKMAGPIPIGSDKSAELITYTTVKVNNTVLENNKRRPGEHAGTSYDIKADHRINRVRHDTTINLLLKAYDYDSTSDNDYLATFERKLDIHNCWGLDGGEPPGVYANQRATARGGDAPNLETVKFSFSVAPIVKLDPNKHFREQMWWRFDNFPTAELTRQQYANTFVDVEHTENLWDRIINPFDSLYYELAYKGIASTGNCFGMSLEAVYSRMGRSLFQEPLYQHRGDPADDVNITAANVSAAVKSIINDKHAFQLGASAIDWIATRILGLEAIQPLTVYNRVKTCLARRDWPVVCMVDIGAGKGHCVLPYKCEDGDGSIARPHKIWVGDPNKPWRKGQGDVSCIEIFSGNTFKFGTSYQSSTIVAGLLPGTLLLEIPYNRLSSQPRTPFWEIMALLSLVGLFLLGGDAETEQVTVDGRELLRNEGGKRLFQTNVAPGLMRMPQLDGSGAFPELWVQRDRMPSNLKLDLRGKGDGQFSHGIASRTNVVTIDSPIKTGFSDRLEFEGLRTPRPMLHVETSEASKIARIGYASVLDPRTRDVRQVSVELQSVKGAVSHVGAAPRGNAFTIAQSGPARPIDLSFDSQEQGRTRRSTLRVTPTAGEAIRVRPDWNAPDREVVVEHLTSIDGGVTRRVRTRPTIR